MRRAMLGRPTPRELHRKLAQAQQALDLGHGLFANPAKAVGELYTLNIGDTSEIWQLIRALLKELLPEHYVGGNPPMRSYEKKINGQELFAFSWWSEHLSKQMYLKFALKEKRYYYVSLHANVEKKRI